MENWRRWNSEQGTNGMLKNALVCVKHRRTASLQKPFINTKVACQLTAEAPAAGTGKADWSCLIGTRDSKKDPGLGCGLGTGSLLQLLLYKNISVPFISHLWDSRWIISLNCWVRLFWKPWRPMWITVFGRRWWWILQTGRNRSEDVLLNHWLNQSFNQISLLNHLFVYEWLLNVTLCCISAVTNITCMKCCFFSVDNATFVSLYRIISQCNEIKLYELTYRPIYVYNCPQIIL